jgi:hypothetical protein
MYRDGHWKDQYEPQLELQIQVQIQEQEQIHTEAEISKNANYLVLTKIHCLLRTAYSKPTAH